MKQTVYKINEKLGMGTRNSIYLSAGEFEIAGGWSKQGTRYVNYNTLFVHDI